MKQLILKLSLCNKANFFLNLRYRMKHSPGKKNHQHSHYLLNIFTNYFNDVIKSFDQFLRQYLTPEGRQLLAKFNKYMFIAIFINVEIYLSIYIILSILLLVKVAKMRQTSNGQKHQNFLSVGWWKKIWTKIKQKLNKNIKKDLKMLEQQHSVDLQLMVSTSNTTSNQQQGQRKVMINLTQEDLQAKIYSIIGRLLNAYAKFINYIKFKGIFLMVVFLLLVYLLEPQFKHDTFRVRARSGEKGLQIHSIKLLSQYLNQFYLIFFTFSLNVITFFIYGTDTLKKQLVEELYDVQKSKQKSKSNKLKVSRNMSMEQSNEIVSDNAMIKPIALARSMSYIQDLPINSNYEKFKQSKMQKSVGFQFNQQNIESVKNVRMFQNRALDSSQQVQSPSPFYGFSNSAKQSMLDIGISNNGLILKPQNNQPAMASPLLRKQTFDRQSKYPKIQQKVGQEEQMLSEGQNHDFKLHLKKIEVQNQKDKQSAKVTKIKKTNQLKTSRSFFK